MFKKIFFLSAYLTLFNSVKSQNVGINSTGATPNASAMLDVSSTSKGILIPNVTLTSTTSNAPIGASVATSLLVYNTTAAGSGATAVYAGYYYWDGTKWVRLASGNADAWLTTGNVGTTASTSSNTTAVNNNFIGTTDNTDFVVATNNLEVARFFKSPTENMVVNSTTAVTNDIFSSYSPTAAGNAMAGYNTYSGTSGGNGVLGSTTADNGNGVKGKSTTVTTSTTVIPTGVYGQAAAIHGIGVYGQNTNASGTGVVGAGNGLSSIVPTSGAGGSFYSTNYGVYALLAPSTAAATASAIYSDGASKGYSGIFMNGNMGVGTASPASVTDILGSSASRILTVSNTGTGDVIRAYSTGTTMLPGYAGLFADVDPNTSGTGYNITTANSSTQSQMASSGTLPAYSFGVFGNVFTTSGSPKRNGGVIGTGIYTNQWASLGYVSSGGTIAGLYYNSTYGSATGGGRLSSSASDQNVYTGVGIIGNSDAFGIIANGGKGGLFVSGEKMGSFIDGVVYTNNIGVQLNIDNESKKTPTFYATSTSVDIQSRGQGRLQNGHIRINFEDVFTSTISDQVPVNITITALGKSNGIYIESVDSKGFDVYENNNGTANIAFNWLAIGVKKGFEQPELNADVLKPDFESNMKQVSSNESDPSVTNKPIWWDGRSFRFDAPPAGTRPFSPGKKSEKTAN